MSEGASSALKTDYFKYIMAFDLIPMHSLFVIIQLHHVEMNYMHLFFCNVSPITIVSIMAVPTYQKIYSPSWQYPPIKVHIIHFDMLKVDKHNWRGNALVLDLRSDHHIWFILAELSSLHGMCNHDHCVRSKF